MATDVDALVATRGDGLRERLVRVEERLRAIADEAAARPGRAGRRDDRRGGQAAASAAGAAGRGRPAAGDDAGLIRAAAAVELVHSATLVHDDVLDRSALRRGRATVWATAGRDAAIATGDYLFARAFSELVANGRVDEVAVLSRASSALAEGELLQREDAYDADRHAGALPAALRAQDRAAVRGGLPAGRAGGRRRRRRAGALRPRASGSPSSCWTTSSTCRGRSERTGKPRGTDLLDGTVTLPFILARERDPSLREAARVRTPAEAEALCDRIAATGALEAARERALAIVAQAKAGLPVRDAALDLVADGVVARYA